MFTADVVQTGPEVHHSLGRILVATDRSATADLAVRWAAELASRYSAELIVLQVLAPAADAAADRRSGRGQHRPRGCRAPASGEGTWQARGAAPRSSSIPILRRPSCARSTTRRSTPSWSGTSGWRGGSSFCSRTFPIACPTTPVALSSSSTPHTWRAWRRPRPRPSRTSETPLERRLLGRALKILRVLVKTSVKEFRSRFRADADGAMRDRARRIRDALQELGPTFAKLGQVLSTRPDLLPAEHHRGARDAAGKSHAAHRTGSGGGDGARAGRAVGGRVCVHRSRSRSPPARSARCITPRWNRASVSSSRFNGRRRSRTSRSISGCWSGWRAKLAARPGSRRGDRCAALHSSVVRFVATRARLSDARRPT